MKYYLLLGIFLTGCSQSVKQEDMQALNANIVKINARLNGIDNDIADIKDYLHKRAEVTNRKSKHRQEFEKDVLDRLNSLDTRVNNLMPIYHHK